MSSLLRRRKLVHIIAVALYTFLALVLSWPLVQHLGTHVPGSYTWAFDEYTFVWNTWWFRYALFDLGQNPLYATHIFYPLGISLVLYTYNLFNALISLPFQAFLPLPAISNLTFLWATVLSGYGTFLLVEYLLQDLQPSEPATSSSSSSARYLAAFLAGLIYAFGSFRMVYAAIGHYDMWSTAWIPLYALFLSKTIREPRLRNAVFAGLFLVLAMLNEMIFGVFLALLTLILLAFVLGRCGRAEVAGGLGSLVKRLLVLGLIAGLLYLPLLLPILREMSGGYELGRLGRCRKALRGPVGPGHAHGAAPPGGRLGRCPAPDPRRNLALPRREHGLSRLGGPGPGDRRGGALPAAAGRLDRQLCGLYSLWPGAAFADQRSVAL